MLTITQNLLRIIPVFVILLGIFLFPEKSFFAYITEDTIIELTNEQRSKNNIASLTKSISLTKAAQKKGEEILQKQLFQHNFPEKSFSQWIKDENYAYAYVGENLAIDFVTSESVVKAWMESESHRKNILNNNFSEVGIAIVEGDFKGEATSIVVQIFATPLGSLNLKEIENEAPNTLNIQSTENNTKEQVSEIYIILQNQKQLLGKFNPISANNIRIIIYVTCFYSILLISIFLLQKREKASSAKASAIR